MAFYTIIEGEEDKKFSNKIFLFYKITAQFEEKSNYTKIYLRVMKLHS